MSENKMTLPPWKLEALGGGHNWSIVQGETGIHLANVGDDPTLSKPHGYLSGNKILDNSVAIVSAVNGTYGKGIHPDAVEGLVCELKTTMNYLNVLLNALPSAADHHKDSVISRINHLKAAIEKATL